MQKMYSFQFQDGGETNRLCGCISSPVAYNTPLHLYRDIDKKNEAWRRVTNVVGAPGVFFVLLNSVLSHYVISFCGN